MSTGHQPAGTGAKPDECALITSLVSRRLARPAAALALRLRLSANQVTAFSGLCWMASLPLAVVAGSASRSAPSRLWIACAILWVAGYYLDLVDGSLARMTSTSSRRGFYLDAVFHYLFKPSYLASLGVALSFSLQSRPALQLAVLLLAVLSIPANWSASASAAEHVLCQHHGKGSLQDLPDSAANRALWLGTEGAADVVATKSRTFLSIVATLAKEIFSYYCQMVFFAATVAVDLCIRPRPSLGALPVTLVCFLVLSALLILRVPFRVYRDFARVRLSDPR